MAVRNAMACPRAPGMRRPTYVGKTVPGARSARDVNFLIGLTRRNAHNVNFLIGLTRSSAHEIHFSIGVTRRNAHA